MNFFRHIRTSPQAASIAVALGGIIWGFYWIPSRLLHDAGIIGAWPALVLFTIALLTISPWLWTKRTEITAHWHVLIICGVAGGAGMALFSAALVLTEVVKATLLFYLSPVWATIVGYIVLGERFRLARLIAVIMGLGGAVTLLGIGDQIPLPKNIGDWLGLLSGFMFAVATVIILRMKHVSVTEQVGAFMFGTIVCSASIIVIANILHFQPLASIPSLDAFIAIWPHLIWGGAFTIPLVFLVMWPAKVISPGRVSLLLMGEIIVGALSAMWLAEEYLDFREITGGLLIICAGLVEIFWQPSIAFSPPKAANQKIQR